MCRARASGLVAALRHDLAQVVDRVGRGLPQAAAQMRMANANRGRVIRHDANIALMAKFKPVRAKPKRTGPPQGAVGCVVLIVLAILGVMLFMYFVMRNANG